MNQTKLTIIGTRFSANIVDRMVQAAEDEIANKNCKVSRTIRVAGAYEIPFAAKKVMIKGESDAIVVLAFIEKGETLHGHVMGNVVHAELVRLSLDAEVPLGIGIIGPGATLEQAEERWDGYARAAVCAAIALIEDAQEL
jgi:6,7-dimethyl-8-ribityllumazine synthase